MCGLLLNKAAHSGYSSKRMNGTSLVSCIRFETHLAFYSFFLSNVAFDSYLEEVQHNVFHLKMNTSWLVGKRTTISRTSTELAKKYFVLQLIR